MPGLIHIYCGDGKGKTTAGVGLAVRCAGGGGKVMFASFLKDDKSGERNILDNIENIELIKNPEKTGFYKFMDENEKENCKKICRDTFSFIKKHIFENHYDLLILDEIIPVINHGIIEENEVMDFLSNRPENLEVVLTGRNPSDRLIETADYVTEMKKIKHPFDKGIKARTFIEM